MKSEFEIAITQLCSDRNLPAQVILEAIEQALVSAYRRNYGANQNVDVSIDSRTGQARVYVSKTVVDNIDDDRIEMSVAEARTYQPDAKAGDMVQVELTPRNFGRIAAQTAKQVIMQRIREAERDSVYAEYAERAGEVVNGIVRNIDGRSGNVTISMGKAEAVLARGEQIPGEHYRFGQRLRVYIVDVERGGHGPQISVSRTHRGLLRRLLELEVPEIYNGTVEVKAIAREAGSRSKVAVAALQPGVDPVGSCVGMRGVRIQNIVNELNGEKIDVVAWSADDGLLIANALSPAKVLLVRLNREEKAAQVVVPDRALSLAIGKEGQNARLAAKLTGWRIDIRSETEAAAAAERLEAEMKEAAQKAQELAEARRAAAELLAEAEALLAAEGEEEGELLEAQVPEEGSLAAELEGVPEEQLEPEAAAEVVTEAEAEVAEALPETALSEGAEIAAAAEEEQAAAEAAAAAEEMATEEMAAAEETAAAEEVAAEEEQAAAETAAAEEAAAEEYEEEESEILADAAEDQVWEEVREEPEAEEETRQKRSAKKDRKRVLQYDEESGRVIARRVRKPTRRGQWEDQEDW